MSEYFNNIIYGIKSFLSGMSLTYKHFKDKKDLVATLQYPHEKWPKVEENIGFDHSEYNVIRSRLHVDIDDCIGCLQCERACPVDCIKIDTIKPPKGSDYDCGMTSNDTQKKMIVPRFTIDMSECMYCDLCVHPCPEECIYMVGGPNEHKHEIDYEFSQYERNGLIYEFATATDQEIVDIGGQTYLDERNKKEDKKIKGENLEGIVESENIESDSQVSDDDSKPKPNKDPLLVIFNIVPDKIARGIAKKAVVFGKRNKMDFPSMAVEVEKRISSAGKTSSEMSTAIENLKNYVASLEVEENIKKDTGDSSENVNASNSNSAVTPQDSFTVKSLDFIDDKMIRGVAKKSFMAGKRSDLDGNAKIDLIIKDLEKANKITDDIKNTLLSLKVDSISNVESKEISDKRESLDQKEGLFNIKSLDVIEDKMIRGSSKKIYMAGKRAGKTSKEVIDDILGELSDSIDDNLKKKIEDII